MEELWHTQMLFDQHNISERQHRRAFMLSENVHLGKEVILADPLLRNSPLVYDSKSNTTQLFPSTVPSSCVLLRLGTKRQHLRPRIIDAEHQSVVG